MGGGLLTMSNPQWAHRLTAEDRRRGAQAANAARISPEAIVQRALRQLYRDLLSENASVRLRATQVTLTVLWRDAKPQDNKRDISTRLLEQIAKLGGPPPQQPMPPADADSGGKAGHLE